MDTNQPTNPPGGSVNLGSTPPAAVPSAPLAASPVQSAPPTWQTQPTPQEASLPPSGQAKQGESHILVIAALLILVVALIGGAYFFMSNQRTSEDAVGKTTFKQPVTQNEFAGLENEANSIDVESNDSDFVDVDKDLQSL